MNLYKDTVIKEKDIRKQQTAPGIFMQNLGHGERMNVLHWNMEDGSIVDWHSHENEQFGYVIKGGFKLFFGEAETEEYEIGQGDCYFVPPNVAHKFIAISETEAIDVFNPIRTAIPKEID